MVMNPHSEGATAFSAVVDALAGLKSGERPVFLEIGADLGTGRHDLRVMAWFQGGLMGGQGPQLLVIEADRITAEDLRRLPMLKIDEIRRSRRFELVDPGSLPKLERGARSPEAFSRLVAEHYLAWSELDAHPAQRMATEYHLNPRTVHSWVREARLRGFLPPAARARRPASDTIDAAAYLPGASQTGVAEASS